MARGRHTSFEGVISVVMLTASMMGKVICDCYGVVESREVKKSLDCWLLTRRKM